MAKQWKFVPGERDLSKILNKRELSYITRFWLFRKSKTPTAKQKIILDRAVEKMKAERRRARSEWRKDEKKRKAFMDKYNER